MSACSYSRLRVLWFCSILSSPAHLSSEAVKVCHHFSMTNKNTVGGTTSKTPPPPKKNPKNYALLLSTQDKEPVSRTKRCEQINTGHHVVTIFARQLNLEINVRLWQDERTNSKGSGSAFKLASSLNRTAFPPIYLAQLSVKKQKTKTKQ